MNHTPQGRYPYCGGRAPQNNILTALLCDDTDLSRSLSIEGSRR